MTVHNCGTQYSTEQTIITAQVTSIGGEGALTTAKSYKKRICH